MRWMRDGGKERRMKGTERKGGAAPGRGRLPGGGVRSADNGGVKGELPERPRPAPGRDRLPDSNLQMADDGGVDSEGERGHDTSGRAAAVPVK